MDKTATLFLIYASLSLILSSIMMFFFWKEVIALWAIGVFLFWVIAPETFMKMMEEYEQEL